MLVILEGPDGAGKSTLAAQLAEEISRRDGVKPDLMHARPPTRHPLDEYETPLFGYRPGTQRHIICDRWHWGEGIYPLVLRRKTQYDRAVRRHVELFLRSRGALVVYLSEPVSLLRERISVRGDDLVLPQHISRLALEYQQVARTSLLPVIWRSQHGPHNVELTDYVYPNVSVEQIVDTAIEYERMCTKLNWFVTYVGPPRPNYLVLGERRNERGSTVDSPAFGPYPATSGHYLLSHMTNVRSVGLANACDVDDWASLHAVLGHPKILTLGQLARKRLLEDHRRTGYPRRFGSVPHPQFVRRFHHAAGRHYGQMILAAMTEEVDLSSWRPS